MINSAMRGPVYGYAKSANKNVIWGGKFGHQSAPFCLNKVDSFYNLGSACHPSVFSRNEAEPVMFNRVVAGTSDRLFNRPVYWRIKNSEHFLAH